MKKRVFSVFLAICMLLSLMPAALASESGTAADNSTAEAAEVNGAKYTTLKDAINAVGNGGTVTLLKDITLTAELEDTRDISYTLDGAGHKISGVGLRFNGADCALKNIVFEGCTGGGGTNNGILEFVNSKSSVTNCAFNNNNNCSRCIDVDSSVPKGTGTSEVEISGCSFTNNTCSETGVISVLDGVSTSIKNCNFTSNTAASCIVYLGDAASVTGCYFTGNTISGNGANKFTIVAGPYSAGDNKVTLTGNAFLDSGCNVLMEDWEEAYDAINVYDISGNYWVDGNEPVLGTDYSVSGAPSIVNLSYVTNYSIGENGSLTLNGKVDAVAEVDGTYYTTLEAAINAVGAGGTVKLLADVAVSNKISVTKTVTIDGNGHTLSYTGNERAIDVPSEANGASLTVRYLTVNCTAGYCQRGINYNTTGELVLDHVVVKGTNLSYAVNFPRDADGAKVTITGGSMTGNNTLNIWGEDMVINVTDAALISVDENPNEGYAAVVLNNDGTLIANGTKVTFTGGSITAKDEKGELASAVINNTATGTVTISDTTTVTGTVGRVNVAVVLYDGQNEFYGCATLQKAVTRAAESEIATAVLLWDNAETVTVTGNVALDLNGHSFTGTIKLASDATLEAEEGLTVTTDVEGKAVSYVDGVYKLIDQYTVTFAVDGGSAVEAQKIPAGGKAVKPAAAPTKSGYTFEGWYADSACTTEFDFNAEIGANTTVYAKWELIPHVCDIKSVEKVDPTCTAPGKQAYYKCEGCGKFFEDAAGETEITDLTTWGNISALGHNWKDADCTTPKTCSVCKVTEGEALGHSWSDWTKQDDGSYKRECAGCGIAETMTISEEKPVDATPEDNAAESILSNTDIELIDMVLTNDEQSEVAAGADVSIYLVVDDVSETVAEEEKAAAEAKAGDDEIGMYLDINLFKKVDTTETQVTETSGLITITITIPDELLNTDASVTRTYKIVRVHEDEDGTLVTDILEGVFDAKDKSFTFKTDKFSTYALAYADTNTNAGGTDINTPQTGDNSMMWLWIALLFVGGLGVAGVMVFGKKKYSVK